MHFGNSLKKILNKAFRLHIILSCSRIDLGNTKMIELTMALPLGAVNQCVIGSRIPALGNRNMLSFIMMKFSSYYVN